MSQCKIKLIQRFLDRSYKRGYISYSMDVRQKLYQQDCKIFTKVKSLDNHPLRQILPKIKPNVYNLQRISSLSARPKLNTERFKNSYIPYLF